MVDLLAKVMGKVYNLTYTENKDFLFEVYWLTDCAVTMLAPTKDVSRHIGSPHAKHTPKMPITHSARPPICLPCPPI